jgi:hypothetical protein
MNLKTKGYRAFRLACNEKEISIEIEKYDWGNGS